LKAFLREKEGIFVFERISVEKDIYQKFLTAWIFFIRSFKPPRLKISLSEVLNRLGQTSDDGKSQICPF
jgi:hypothetical protein